MRGGHIIKKIVITAIILPVLAIAVIASISLFGGTPEGDTSDTPVIVATGSGTRYILSAEMPNVNDTYPVYRYVWAIPSAER